MIIVQARMGSTRLPGKVMLDLNGAPMIGTLHERLQETGLPFVYAIPAKDKKPLGEYLESIGGSVVAWDGPEQDVAGRFAYCLAERQPWPAPFFIRVCGDSPYAPVDQSWQAAHLASHYGYGLVQTSSGSIEAVNTGLFLDALPKMTPEEREHVLLYFRRDRLVVDTEEDMERVRRHVQSGGSW